MPGKMPQTLCSPGRIPELATSSSSVFPTRDVDPNQITFPPFLPDSVWLFLYRLDRTGAVLLVLKSILVRITLYVIVVLMFS